MIFARFSTGKEILWGIVEGDCLQAVQGEPFQGVHLSGKSYGLEQVKLLAPAAPSKIVGVGLNYKAVAIAKGQDFPAEPVIFLKPPSSLVGPAEPIVIPPAVKRAAFEVELAVIIGKQAKNVAAAEALRHVFGYTLANDVTAKDHMIKGLPWAKGKSFDTFTPLGPFVVTGLNPADIELAATVNGAVRQQSSTKDMIFGVPELIEFISGIMTLEPGDVILTGTPPGGGEFAAGDCVALTSAPIGTLTSKVL